MQMHRLIFCGISDSLHSVDLLHQLGLEVGSLVLVDDIGLSQLVKHLLHRRIQLHSLFLVGHSAQLANCIAHGLAIITVVLVASLGLTNSLLR